MMVFLNVARQRHLISPLVRLAWLQLMMHELLALLGQVFLPLVLQQRRRDERLLLLLLLGLRVASRPLVIMALVLSHALAAGLPAAALATRENQETPHLHEMIEKRYCFF